MDDFFFLHLDTTVKGSQLSITLDRHKSLANQKNSQNLPLTALAILSPQASKGGKDRLTPNKKIH